MVTTKKDVINLRPDKSSIEVVEQKEKYKYLGTTLNWDSHHEAEHRIDIS